MEGATMKRDGIRLAVLGTMAAAISLAIALPAAGHKVVFPTNLQLKIDELSAAQDTFSGRIDSPRARCEVGRVVNVTHAGTTIATATTDFAGNWTVVGPHPPKGDDVTAFAPKRVLKKNSKHRHRCAPDVTTRKAP
jgi:hypothetical protein